jgi:hypothetical protein
MKTILTTLLLGAAINLYADSWQHMHTFPSNYYSHIAFNGEEFLCTAAYGGFSTNLSSAFDEIAKSTDLQSWTTYTNISTPEALLSNGWYYVGITLHEITALTNGTFIAIVEKTEAPQMGNTDNHSTFSIRSTNGIDWTDLSTVDSFHWGSYYPTGLNTFEDYLLYLNVTTPDGGVIGMPADCEIFKYDPQNNEWTNVFTKLSYPNDSIYLFQDQNTSYLSSPPYVDSWTNSTLCSENGVDWQSLSDGPYNSYVADASDGMIVSEVKVYSIGRGWENAPYAEIKDIIFNGNRLAGRQGEYLIYSDDFGQTIHQTHIPNLTGANIIEANGQYVALLNMQDNTIPTEPHIYRAIYALDSSPTRTAVTEIQGFGTTSEGLNFQSTSNGLYQLECTASLIDPDWKAFGLPKVGTGESIIIDPSENLISNIFFRVRAINN